MTDNSAEDDDTQRKERRRDRKDQRKIRTGKDVESIPERRPKQRKNRHCDSSAGSRASDTFSTSMSLAKLARPDVDLREPTVSGCVLKTNVTRSDTAREQRANLSLRMTTLISSAPKLWIPAFG
eukprot:1335251-Amorphochlora_amoeboformis.AAC.1